MIKIFPKNYQMVIHDDKTLRNIGVGQLFVEGETCFIYGLNGKNILKEIVDNRHLFLDPLGCVEVVATVEPFMASLLKKYCNEKLGIELSVTEPFLKNGINFVKVKLTKGENYVENN